MNKKPIQEIFPGDLIPLVEFLESVEDGFFTDYDGDGYYVTPTHYYTQDVYPSKIDVQKIPDDVTHVMWYNK